MINMIKVGSKVKLNVEVLKQNGFDGFIDEIEISFISNNKETVFEVIHDWKVNEYRYQLKSEELSYVCFKKEELILVEVNAE